MTVPVWIIGVVMLFVLFVRRDSRGSVNEKYICNNHNIKTVVKTIRMEDKDKIFIVVDYKAKQDICMNRGCSYKSELYDRKFLDGYSGCTMPSKMWAEMREKGYIFIED